MNAHVRWFNRWAYKPETGKIYWEKVISSSVVIIGLIAFMIYNQSRVNQRARDRDRFSRYTIGLTLGDYNNIKGSRTIKYKYYVNGIPYTTWNTFPVLMNNIIVNGGKYFVRFSALDPGNAEMLFDFAVPDSIRDIPDSGLTKLPGKPL